MTTSHFDVSAWLPPLLFLVASFAFARGIAKALSTRTVHESAFVADRELEPGKAQLLVVAKFIWLGLSLTALVVSTIVALKQD